MNKEEKRLKEVQAIEEQNRARGVEDFPKSKRLKTPEGTIAYYWDGKLHNWEGPALIPEGDNRKREYYIYGIQYSEDEWKDRKRDGKGLPWFKDPRFKERQAG
ncbi:hypothetical protein OAA39_00225 [bacterium]|jgi:hypothetical protein|nr:hypothetical protein [bacterium]